MKFYNLGNRKTWNLRNIEKENWKNLKFCKKLQKKTWKF